MFAALTTPDQVLNSLLFCDLLFVMTGNYKDEPQFCYIRFDMDLRDLVAMSHVFVLHTLIEQVQMFQGKQVITHDDVIKWKHFPRYWSFVREFTATDEFPSQWPVTRSFGVFFDLRLNKRLSKQWWAWWFENPLCSLWRYCNENGTHVIKGNGYQQNGFID